MYNVILLIRNIFRNKEIWQSKKQFGSYCEVIKLVRFRFIFKKFVTSSQERIRKISKNETIIFGVQEKEIMQMKFGKI